MILLDTGVVSAVLRRRRRGKVEQRAFDAVSSLLDSHESVALPWIVFQEVLSGIADARQFRKVLRGIRENFPVVLADKEDHLRAAQLAHTAAASGITASTPDTLIASQAVGLGSEAPDGGPGLRVPGRAHRAEGGLPRGAARNPVALLAWHPRGSPESDRTRSPVRTRQRAAATDSPSAPTRPCGSGRNLGSGLIAPGKALGGGKHDVEPS